MVLAFVALLQARADDPTGAVTILATLARLREEARIVGAPRDLASQERLRARIEAKMAPELYAEAWVVGHTMSLDDAVDRALDFLRELEVAEPD